MKKEADLYPAIKHHFEKQNFQVYGEVFLPTRRGRVDVIAHNGNEAETVAVEMKLNLSRHLIIQAIHRKAHFPTVYVAIPERKRPIPDKSLDWLAFHGIGILEVYHVGSTEKVRVRQQAQTHDPPRKFRKPWSEMLYPEHQTWKDGGSAGGGYVTEYALTMASIKNYLKRSDTWENAASICANCRTHWANPKKQVVRCLLEFEDEWIEAKKEKNKWWFRAKDVPRETIEGSGQHGLG